MTEYVNKEYYKSLAVADRFYINPGNMTRSFMDRLNAEGIPFSATLGDYKQTVTVSKANRERADLPEIYWLIMLLFIAVVIIRYSPVDNPYKPLSQNDAKKYKMYSIVEILIWFAVVSVMYILCCDLYRIILLTLSGVSILMMVVNPKNERSDVL